MRVISSTNVGLLFLVPLMMHSPSALASVSSGIQVTVGRACTSCSGTTTSTGSLTTDPYVYNTVGGGGAVQFAVSPSCVGLACGIDGPAMSIFLDSGNAFAEADGGFAYTIDVVGAPGPVPILLTGQYAVVDPLEAPNRSGGTVATGVLQVFEMNGPRKFNFQSLCYNYDPVTEEQAPEANCGSGLYHGSFMATAGTTLSVQMNIEIRRLFTDTGLPSASVYFDPFVQIDPIFAAEHPEYSLTFDAGVGNGMPGALDITPVPEPETLLLMAAGLGALALKRRRSKTESTQDPRTIGCVVRSRG